MKLDVLAIGAHPDDIELSAGGTLINLVNAGRQVGIVDLTQGELGTRGTVEIRAREAADAAKILGVHVRDTLDIPDGNIEPNQANTLKLVAILRHYRPDILLIPHSVERHPDHEHAHQLCRQAWFVAGLDKVQTTRDGKIQAPFRPKAFYHFMQTYEFVPSFIVDISDVYEQRMNAVRAFRSQFYDPDSEEPETFLSTPAFMEFLHTRFQYFGDRIGVKYGEPFYSLNMVGIRNLFDLTC